MTYITHASNNVNLFTMVSRIGANIMKSISDHRAFLRTRSELENLSTRELADVGITKGDIKRIAHEAAYKN